MELPRRLLLALSLTLSYAPSRIYSAIATASGGSQQVMSTTADFSEGTVILGAGIIGLSTAYYLALALNESEPQFPHRSNTSIVVIDPSHTVCPAASGTATGGLGDFGFSPMTASLGVLSYILHKELASKFGGEHRYGFSDLGIFRVTPKTFTGTPSPPSSWGPHLPVERSVSDLPPWIKCSHDWKVESLADAPHAAHLDPKQFCRFLRERCEKLGVKFLLNSMVTSIEQDRRSQRFTSVSVATKEPNSTTQTILCSSIVIAAGPWSDRVFSQLLPSARFKLRMNSTYSAGNHLTVRIPHWKPSDDDKGVNQVFLNDVIPGTNGLDITSFLGGTLYVGGRGAKPEPLPKRADSIEAQPDEIAAMVDLTRQYLHLKVDEELEVLDTGRCYRPLAIPNKPIITKVPWFLLSSANSQATIQHGTHENCPIISRGGLFINTGHNGDGVTLALGSGKVMSELLLGRIPSADISGLGVDCDENNAYSQHRI